MQVGYYVWKHANLKLTQSGAHRCQTSKTADVVFFFRGFPVTVIFDFVSSLLCSPAVPCSAGRFSRTGLVPCYPCPRDYYQPEHGRSYCLSCPFYGTTTVIGAATIQQCSSKYLPAGILFCASPTSFVFGILNTKQVIFPRLCFILFLRPFNL